MSCRYLVSESSEFDLIVNKTICLEKLSLKQWPFSGDISWKISTAVLDFK